uniref:Uncharacterized protein n=1 Tax=Arundo donax TaxID=35708 RepID=A0A0A9EJ61_ARUDO
MTLQLKMSKKECSQGLSDYMYPTVFKASPRRRLGVA